MSEVDAKSQAFAKVIEGRVVDDKGRVEVCIKGTVLGFPATLEAINASWPFGVNYYIETHVIDDPNKPDEPNKMKITILPRVARGIASFFARVLLIEPKGQAVGDKKIEKNFICSYTNYEETHRFFQYPGVHDKLIFLHDYSKFSELLIKADAGIVLSQPFNFKSLDPDIYRETFKSMAELGQVLFEAF